MSNSPCEICENEHADSYASYTVPLELCTVAEQEYDIWLCGGCIEWFEQKLESVGGDNAN